MILDTNKLVVGNDLPIVTLRLISPETREMILNFVKKEYESFLKYYESPKVGTEVYAILYNEQMIGTVLIEKQPNAAVTPTDGAISCLVISRHMRGKKLGSAAIVATCLELQSQGYQRVIAEWVASIELYRRLGFRVWKTREISLEQ